MTSRLQLLDIFNKQVDLKYQVYNGIFLTLPFQNLKNQGIKLPLFAEECEKGLSQGKTPKEIIDSFFKTQEDHGLSKEDFDTLFLFLQFIERQVVLFDALEDAAYAEVNDLHGVGSISHLLTRINTPEQCTSLAKSLQTYKIRIVLTAHPTQFYTDVVLGVLADLTQAIKVNDLYMIHQLLLQLGKTPFKNKIKPSPLDEAKSLLWYLEHVFFVTVPEIQKQLEDFLPKEPNQPKKIDPQIELGFWPGGDRDGNPFVTADVTLKVGELLKCKILMLYLDQVKALKKRLTFKGIIEDLSLLEERLLSTLRAAQSHRALDGKPFDSSIELLDVLNGIYLKLVKDHDGFFLEHLEHFILQIRMFGFHFAILDIRQNSTVHGKSLQSLFEELARDSSLTPSLIDPMRCYATLDSSERMSLLEQILKEPNLICHEEHEVLETLRVARSIQLSNGARSVHRYIISNAQSAIHVFEVLVLAHLSGWSFKKLTLDIVPLFETIDDLAEAPRIMKRLYEHPLYRAHLEKRQRLQTIMLGFSDGTKDGGYLSGSCSIFNAKMKLVEVSRQHGVELIFFDGRGGPPARGGGHTHKFYEAMSHHVDQQEIHVTIQGQTITSNYGTRESARFNLEQIYTAGLEAKVLHEERPKPLEKPLEQSLNRLSRLSQEAYVNLRDDPLTVPFLEQMTPLRFYQDLNFASRPYKRGKAKDLQFGDLRAISFVGAWTQMKQNILGFYGFGIALEEFLNQGKQEDLERLYQHSFFFRTLVQNSMQSLLKSNRFLTRFIENDETFGKFWEKVDRELDRTSRLLLKISRQEKLLDQALVIRESILLREKIVLPLAVIQQYALIMLRQSGSTHPKGDSKETTLFEKIVAKSLAANINASRNSV